MHADKLQQVTSCNDIPASPGWGTVMSCQLLPFHCAARFAPTATHRMEFGQETAVRPTRGAVSCCQVLPSQVTTRLQEGKDGSGHAGGTSSTAMRPIARQKAADGHETPDSSLEPTPGLGDPS